MLSVAVAAVVARVLFNLEFYSVLHVLSVLLAVLFLYVELPNWVVLPIVLSLVFRSWYFPIFEIVLAVFPVILVGELNHAVPIRPGGYGQARTIVAEIGGLVDLLSSIDVFRKLTSELLAS